jgi:hypothetical protein
MDQAMRWIRDAAVPPGAEWHLFPVAVGSAGLLALALLVLLRRWGSAAPLPGAEADAARSAPVRALAWALRGTALLLPLAALAAAAVPGPPSVVVLPGGTQPDAAARRPGERGWHRVIDARLAIKAALAELAEAGAVGWFAPEADTIRQTRKASLAAARALCEGKPLRPDSPGPLPPWVSESVEMTVVRALAIRTRAAWVGVDAGPARPNQGWDAERASYAAAGLAFDLRAEAADDRLAVRQLWNGRLQGGRARFRALVRGSPGGGHLRFQAGDTPFDVYVPEDGKTWRRIEIDEPLASPASRAVALPSGLSTPLVDADTADGAGLVLTLPRSWAADAPLVDTFTATWQELLGPQGDLTSALVARRGLTVPRLEVRDQPSDTGANLVLAETMYRVQPAGTGKDDPPFAPATTGPEGVTRVLSSGDRGPDSFTALDAPAGGAYPLRGGRWAVEGVLTGSALADGRRIVGVRQARPVITTAAAGGRLATAIHLPPRSLLKPGEEDPSRLRATLAALVAAANDAIRPASAAEEVSLTASADVPRGRCLLSENDARELADEASVPALTAAAVLAAGYFLLLFAHAAVWLRPAVSSLR